MTMHVSMIISNGIIIITATSKYEKEHADQLFLSPFQSIQCSGYIDYSQSTRKKSDKTPYIVIGQ